MMDQTHIGYTYWQEPPRNTMPRVDVIQLPLRADMGVAIVEANRPAPPGRGGPFGGGAAPFGAPREAALPPFDPYSRQTYHVDVYNRGATPFEFSAQTAEPWLIISPSRGTIDKQQRVAISVDWSRAPIGERRVGVTFTGPNESRSVVQAVINNPAAPNRDSVVGFVEGAGFISMEAEHYTNAVRSRAVGWQRIPDFGRTLSGMTMTPVTSAAQTPGGSAPRLDYQVFLFDSGAVKVRAFFSPTFNFTAAKGGLRYAISFDDEPPQIVDAQADTATRGWEREVGEGIVQRVSSHAIARPGVHVLKFWAVDPGLVLQKIVIEAREIAPSFLGPPESYFRMPATQVRKQ
jgi:hypothetical protein